MILSIDIGLKNLAFCIMSCTDPRDLSTYNIHLWDVYNTLEEDLHFCSGLKRNGDRCGKRCLYKYNNANETIFTCKTHFPKTITIKPSNHYRQRLIKDYLLQDIAKIVLTRVNQIYNDHKTIFDQLTQIIIELQPKINLKMKLVSHIVYGKLVELFMDHNTTIRFIRASQKLKAYTGPEIECKLKGSYAKRKWLSIQYTRWFLETKFNDEQKNMYLPFFESHTKQDDMSDAALMAINGLHGIPKRQRINKNGSCIK
jgi:hypothetical protein